VRAGLAAAGTNAAPVNSTTSAGIGRGADSVTSSLPPSHAAGPQSTAHANEVPFQQFYNVTRSDAHDPLPDRALSDASVVRLRAVSRHLLFRLAMLTFVCQRL
jgi:hypothetical protein